MAFEIQKNVPLGSPRREFSEACKACEIGDSFFAPIRQEGLASRTAQFKPKKFTSRSCTENGVKGIRVWRIL